MATVPTSPIHPKFGFKPNLVYSLRWMHVPNMSTHVFDTRKGFIFLDPSVPCFWVNKTWNGIVHFFIKEVIERSFRAEVYFQPLETSDEKECSPTKS
jgi:hypothetical protein